MATVELFSAAVIDLVVARGLPFLRIHETVSVVNSPDAANGGDNVQWTINYGNFYGIAVGPDSDIDLFSVRDDMFSGTSFLTPRNPHAFMQFYVEAGNAGVLITSPRAWAAGSNPVVDLFLFLKPLGPQWFQRGDKYLSQDGQDIKMPYTAANAVLDTDATGMFAYGRRKINVVGGVSSAATVRFDIYGYADMCGIGDGNTITPFPTLLYSATTLGTAADGFAASVDVPHNIARVGYVVTKTAGGVVGDAYLRVGVAD